MYDIVINPATGSGRGRRAFHKIRPLLDEAGICYRVHFSGKGKSIREIVRKLTSAGPSDIIIIGGDGSMNEAVNGIADFKNTRLGFIPCGSGNDLAKDLGIRPLLVMARRFAANDCTRLVDIGMCEYNGVKRLFNISSGVGFDAETCYYADRSALKGILNRVGLGKLIYILVALRLIFRNKTFDLKIRTSDGRKKKYKKCLFIVGMNHCYEGGGFKFCPDAEDADGLLDFCVVNRITPLKFLWMFPSALSGKHVRYEEVHLFRAEELEISLKEPRYIHHDGEAKNKTDFLKLSVYPEKLRLIV